MPKPTVYPAPGVPLWPLKTAADASGLSTYMFARGVERGEIPVPIETIGRKRFVRREALAAWLLPSPKKPLDLF